MALGEDAPVEYDYRYPDGRRHDRVKPRDRDQALVPGSEFPESDLVERLVDPGCQDDMHDEDGPANIEYLHRVSEPKKNVTDGQFYQRYQRWNDNVVIYAEIVFSEAVCQAGHDDETC